ncbi:glycosyl transferase [Fulvivirga sp. M361]|uniref:glycosyltransferase family protein n=1 Tax=Fulvivirga sp. M361 TaxID=2594266 RepID=UPI001179DD6C|nr:glycosyltransferase family protein [Fulvivirga sp. M361]TRX60705.1 glycosyl transferase [Fulvivirga sp. M361]
MNKILYAIQGTGNGHLSRAHDVAPALEKHGKVDYFVSGAQCEIDFPYEIKYRSPGLSFFFGKSGGINYSRTFFKNSARRLYKEIKHFPVEDYDLIINDFEPISAWAAKAKGKKCVALSHQSAVISNDFPKPDTDDRIGAAILKNYAPATTHYGFHFESRKNNIYTPIIRRAIREAKVENRGHFTVYLPAYADEKIIKVLSDIPEIEWQVFSKHSNHTYDIGNISIKPINNNLFIQSITTSDGVLCGAGFETPSEALFLGKKLIVIPMKNQYEQQCNAAALQAMGVPVLKKLKMKCIPGIRSLISSPAPLPKRYPDETGKVVSNIVEKEVGNGG